MAYTVDDVLEKAQILIDLSEEDVDKFHIFCSLAFNEFEARLNGTVTVDDIGEIFISAASILALAMYTEFTNLDTAKSLNVGEVSITYADFSDRAEYVASLRSLAEKTLLSYIDDDNFSFIGVRS